MSHIYKTILINAPIDKLYNFARDPQHWNTFFIGLGAPEEVKGTGTAGTVAKFPYAIAGVPFPVTIRVNDEKLVGTKAFWKATIEGPLAGNIEWNYMAKTNGETEVTLDINYTVPGKLLGKITDKLLIERMQEKAAAATLENLKLLCEAEVTAPVFA